MEEHNLLGVGFRNYVGQIQGSIRVISALMKTKKYKKYGEHLPKFKIKLQLKLKAQCLECIGILMKGWKLCAEPKTQAWHQKMIGDQYRYATEALDLQQYPEEEEEIPAVTNPEVKAEDIDNRQSIAEPYISEKEMKIYRKERNALKEKAEKAYAFGM